jgi:hypothetical protein
MATLVLCWVFVYHVHLAPTVMRPTKSSPRIVNLATSLALVRLRARSVQQDGSARLPGHCQSHAAHLSIHQPVQLRASHAQPAWTAQLMELRHTVCQESTVQEVPWLPTAQLATDVTDLATSTHALARPTSQLRPPQLPVVLPNTLRRVLSSAIFAQ